MEQSLLPPGTQDKLALMHRFIDDYQFPEPNESSETLDGLPLSDHRATYKNALKFFENSTRQIDLAGPHVEPGMVLMWAYSLSKRFRDDLEAYQPPALVLLGYWCVLLHIVDNSWFIKGASKRLLEDIEIHMHPTYNDWLVWPKKWVFGH